MPTPDFAKKPLNSLDDGSLVLHREYLQTIIELDHADGAADEHALEAFIKTPRLMIFSAGHSRRDNQGDSNTLVKFYGDTDNMKLYASGKPLAAENVLARHEERCKRWLSANVFSSFMVDTEDGTTIGQTVFGASGKPGVSECAVIIDKEFQYNGFGTESIVAHSYFWAPYITNEGYQVGGAKFTDITATAHPDNGTSKLFPRAGYNLIDTIDHAEYGSKRNVYSLPLEYATATVENTKMKLR